MTIVLEGHAGHAGTMVHGRRRDALAGAAEIILQIEKIGRETAGLFATVGNVQASPGLSNVISGRAELWLDLRHESDEVRLASFEKIMAAVNSIATSRGLDAHVASPQQSPATQMDPKLSRHLEGSIQAAGLPVESLVSGAGHDAMIMARMTSACMLFVRCRGGIAHHPDEYVALDDIRVALDVVVQSLIRISNTMGQ